MRQNNPPSLASKTKRLAYLLLGFISLGLGIIGAVVPLMPSVCFILLAAWAFARSSERWHTKLRTHPRFGMTVCMWEDHRCLSRRGKRIALIAIAISFSISIVLVRQSLYIVLLLVLIMTILIVYIWTRKEWPLSS